MEEYFECPVCCERYDSGSRRPKMLPCGHTFCLSCLLAQPKKCSNCRTPYKDHQDRLPDNFTLLSASENAPTRKKFWCLDCKAEATAECLEEHSICSMKKILLDRVKNAHTQMKAQLSQEFSVLQEITVKLDVVKTIVDLGNISVKKEVTGEMNGLNTSKQDISKLIESCDHSIRSAEETVLAKINEDIKKSSERLPVLKHKLSLLKHIEKCQLTVNPCDTEISWKFDLDLSRDDVSNVEGRLFYLLYVLLGRQNVAIPNVDDHGTGDASSAPLCPPTVCALSIPYGKCIMEIQLGGDVWGNITIGLIESIKIEKKSALTKALMTVKLYPKPGMLTGPLSRDIFLKENNIPVTKGTVGIARLPLHPLQVYVQSPGKHTARFSMFVLGRIMEDSAILEALWKDCFSKKMLAKIISVRWSKE